MSQKICLLGATGSIGDHVLDLIAQHSDQFEVVALSAHSNVEKCLSAIKTFKPKVAVMVDDKAAQSLQNKVSQAGINTEILAGAQALDQIASLAEVDLVVAAIVGGAGLPSVLKAADAGKTILLANKEALVMAGPLMMDKVKQKNAVLLPIDSEHNALFQCMPPGFVTGNRPEGVDKIILTASGGPFLHQDASTFDAITPEQAIKHPNWSMGAKISIDCATLMNKGLEVIEAYYLFQMPVDKIEVVVHPQSVIHSLVAYEDGSFLAQLGTPDMRIPISFCLSWPNRIANGASKLDLTKISQLNFLAPDYEKFPCLKYAFDSLVEGGVAPVILNAANEEAVAAFQRKAIKFSDIPKLVHGALEALPTVACDALETVYAYDLKAREWARNAIKAIH